MQGRVNLFDGLKLHGLTQQAQAARQLSAAPSPKTLATSV
jgi:hypothetical protein